MLAKGDHIVPIPGTTSIAHLEENMGAAALTLSEDTIAQVETIFSGTIAGPRYAAMMQAQIDTETFAGEELA